jgi:Putative DNA-binding domain
MSRHPIEPRPETPSEVLLGLLEHGECTWLEYKTKLPDHLFNRADQKLQLTGRGELLKDLQALVNAEDDKRKRYLVYGIKDLPTERRIEGLNELPAFDGADLAKWIGNAFEPPFPCEVARCELEGKQLLLLTVTASDHGPHVAKSDYEHMLRAGQVWFRRGPGNIVATREALERLFRPLETPQERHARVRYQRFLEVLNWHALDEAQSAKILARFKFDPGVFGHQRDTLARLDDEALEFICAYFSVNREWLMDRDDNKNVTRHYWSDRVQAFGKRILELIKADSLSCVHLLNSDEVDPAAEHEPARTRIGDQIGFVLELTHPLGTQEYTTYEPWGFERWWYPRTRLEFLTVIWFLERLTMRLQGRTRYWFVRGTTLAREQFEAMWKGELHFAEILRLEGSLRRWYPEVFLASANHEAVSARASKTGLDQL